MIRRLSRARRSPYPAIHRESGGVAGHAARGVADDDRELVAVVGSGGFGFSDAAAAEISALPLLVALPVSQGCRARGRDREGRPLTGGHRLTRRLSRDR